MKSEWKHVSKLLTKYTEDGFSSIFRYHYIFPGDYLLMKLNLGDTASGVILLIFSLLLLCGCLVLLVKVLNSILRGKIAKLIRKFINSELPGPCSYFTGYLAIFVGAILTILVQSSSVFTSALTPLVGLGVIKLERMYPLTLGSNIGTTATGLLAALAAPGEKFSSSLQIALVHLFFNISGIVLFYPLPFMRLPIRMAKKLGEITAVYRWFALMYLGVMFFILPALVFALSFAKDIVFYSVVLCVVLAIVAALLFHVIVTKMQKSCPKSLPNSLKSYGSPPVWQKVLNPLDLLLVRISQFLANVIPCCKRRLERKAEEPRPVELQRLRQRHESYVAETAAKEQAKDIPVVHLKTVLSEKKAAAAADTTVVTVTVDSGIGTMINNTPFSLSRNLSQSQLSDVES